MDGRRVDIDEEEESVDVVEGSRLGSFVGNFVLGSSAGRPRRFLCPKDEGKYSVEAESLYPSIVRILLASLGLLTGSLPVLDEAMIRLSHTIVRTFIIQ